MLYGSDVHQHALIRCLKNDPGSVNLLLLTIYLPTPLQIILKGPFGPRWDFYGQRLLTVT